MPHGTINPNGQKLAMSPPNSSSSLLTVSKTLSMKSQPPNQQMNQTKTNQSPTGIKRLPLHFKGNGRSYSQLGRRGNVALYAVYSDYFLLHGFVAPYLLIGFELVCCDSKRNGVERYPRDEEFGQRALSIPKSIQGSCRVPPRLRRSESYQFIRSSSETILDRSTTPEESAVLAQAQFNRRQFPSPAYQTSHKEATRRVTLLGRLVINNYLLANN
jgi:hypothetical protein